MSPPTTIATGDVAIASPAANPTTGPPSADASRAIRTGTRKPVRCGSGIHRPDRDDDLDAQHCQRLDRKFDEGPALDPGRQLVGSKAGRAAACQHDPADVVSGGFQRRHVRRASRPSRREDPARARPPCA